MQIQEFEKAIEAAEEIFVCIRWTTLGLMVYFRVSKSELKEVLQKMHLGKDDSFNFDLRNEILYIGEPIGCRLYSGEADIPDGFEGHFE